MTDTPTRPRWMLKTVAPDGAAHGGFVWPLTVGAEVSAPDFNDQARCGGGLHGLANGIGAGGLLDWSPSAVWLVAEIPDDATLVDLDNKVKVDRCVIAHVGDRHSCTAFLAEQGVVGAIVAGTATAGVRGTATAGVAGTATAGDRGTATAGDEGTATAGDRGTATAGDEGTATAGDRGTATAGYGGTATAGDGGTATAGVRGTATAGYAGTATAGVRGTATAGDRGTATAGDEGTATAGDGGTATAGDEGTATAGVAGTATAGVAGTATAGDGGVIVITFWANRYRRKVGEIGEGGLKANVAYRLDPTTHDFVEAAS